MNAQSRLAVSMLALLSAQYDGLTSTEVGPEQEVSPDAAPWKLRLHGANKDRRAARKKRAKKLNRRR